MAKKSTRGRIRERVDYSELLADIKNKSSEVSIQKEDQLTLSELQENSVKTEKHLSHMLSDEKNLFFHHHVNNLLHEKHCDLIKTLPADELTPLSDYMIGPKQCPNCALRTYLRIGAED